MRPDALIGFPALIDKDHACRDRGLRRARPGRCRAPPRRSAGGSSRCRCRDAAQVPREEHPRAAPAWRWPTWRSVAPATNCASRSSRSHWTALSSSDPLPTRMRRGFCERRVDEGRGAAQPHCAARWHASAAGVVLARAWTSAMRKLKDARPAEGSGGRRGGATRASWCPKRFLVDDALARSSQHLPRYLKAVTSCGSTSGVPIPPRDAQRLAELRPIEQRFLKRVLADLRGAADCAARRVPMAAGGAAREPVRTGAAHAAAGQRQAPGQGLGATATLMPSWALGYSAPVPFTKEQRCNTSGWHWSVSSSA